MELGKYSGDIGRDADAKIIKCVMPIKCEATVPFKRDFVETFESHYEMIDFILIKNILRQNCQHRDRMIFFL